VGRDRSAHRQTGSAGLAERQLLGKRLGPSVATKPKDAEPQLRPLSPKGLKGNEPIPLDDDSFGPVIIDPAEESRARDAFARENEWLKLKNKWSPETQIRIVYEFLRKRDLYGELVKHVRKMR
jgi:hypothetical protein